MRVTSSKIGIIGAGKLGVVLAQLALKAGYTVYIAGSGDAQKIMLSTKVLTPGAIAVAASEAARLADIIILALPLSKYSTLPRKDMRGKLIIDATNHWWEIDGDRDHLLPTDTSSSEVIQAFLSQSRVVKAFSHMGYHDLHDESKTAADTNRKAVAVAGDHLADVKIVAALVDAVGFDPVILTSLEEGKYLEPGNAAFGANVNADTLHTILNASISTLPSRNAQQHPLGKHTI